MSDAIRPLTWEVDLPLFGRLMLAQWTAALAAAAVFMMLILGPIAVSEGGWVSLAGLAMLAAACAAGIWALGLLAMALLLWGRFRVRYALDDDGIRFESIDARARAVGRVATGAGVMGRNPGLAGAGLLATSRQSEQVRWGGAFRVVCRPRTRAILLRNRWRTLMWVQCLPENYEVVAAEVKRLASRGEASTRLGARSPLAGYVGRTALVSAACLPSFAAAGEFDTGLLVPIVTVCFALGMVWLTPALGYGVLAGLSLEAVLVAVDLVGVRENTLFPGEDVRGYELLGGEGTGVLAVAGLGALALSWLATRYLTGRTRSALAADRQDRLGA